MDNVKSLLNQVLGGDGKGQGGLDQLLNGRGDLAKGALAGGVAGLLLGNKKGRKFAGNALKIGGLAVVGGLAYKAWRDRQVAAGTPMPADDAAVRDRFLPADTAQAERLNRTLVRAMIAAAKADGDVSDAEWQRIEEETSRLSLSADDRAFIARELAAPLNVGAIADAATSPEEAMEIYAASLLVIDPHGDAEKGYLAMLAARLGLDKEMTARLHDEVDAVTA